MLGKEELEKIIALEISAVLKRLAEKSITLDLKDSARDFLIEEGYDPDYGARPMRRAVEKHLEDPLAELLLRGDIHEGDTLEVIRDPDEDIKALKFSATDLKGPGSKETEAAESKG